MGIFEYNQDELLGTVESVDTSTAIIKVENDDKLRFWTKNNCLSRIAHILNVSVVKPDLTAKTYVG